VEGYQSNMQNALKEMQKTLELPGVWVLSLYFFFFLGAVITAGGKWFPDASSLFSIILTLSTGPVHIKPG
jgi:hypothetical protein